MHDQACSRWAELMATWEVPAAAARAKLGEILAAYTDCDRHYHTLDHVLHVLDTVEELQGHAQHLPHVKLAAWLHDVVYESRASDNEERSADYAVQLCQQLQIPDGARCAGLILQTKCHDAHEDPDAQVLLDADLAILGSPEAEYDRYAAQIRREYAWVPEADYRKGRQDVLHRFLARPRIFGFLAKLERPARVNLQREIASLT